MVIIIIIRSEKFERSVIIEILRIFREDRNMGEEEESRFVIEKFVKRILKGICMYNSWG